MRTTIVLLVIAILSLTFGCERKQQTSSDCSLDSSSSLNNLKEQVQQLMQTRDSLRKQVQQLTKERDEARAEARTQYITLSIIAYSALTIGVVLIVGFVLLAKNAKKDIPVATHDDLHCPRCGWEHAPGETVCRNCKTHF